MTVIVLATAALLLAGQTEPEIGRVRTETPTVVTVRGNQDTVRTDDKRPGKWRIGRPLARAIGWAMNAGDDIPSERELKTRNRSQSGGDSAAASSAGR